MAQGEFDFCRGCAGSDEEHRSNQDHVHWYNNFYGQRVKTITIENHTFTSLTMAIRYLTKSLQCTMGEANEYIRTLPVIYNKDEFQWTIAS